MKTMSVTKSPDSNAYIYFSLLVSAIYAFFPLIRAFPYPVRFAFRILPLILCLIATIKRNRFKLYMALMIIILFGIFNAVIRVYSNANGVDKETNLLEFIIISICYWITVYEGIFLIYNFNTRKAKRLVIFVIRLVNVSSVTTIFGNILYPQITRDSASNSDAINYWFNIGGYGFCLSICFLIPTLIFLIKKGVISKRYYYCLILWLLVPVICQIFTGVIISAIGLIMLVVNPKKFRLLIGISIVFVCLWIIVPISFWGMILQVISNVIGNLGIEIIHERLDGMARLLIEGASYGDVYSRFSLYKISLQHFFNNPLFGLIGEKGFVRQHPTPYELIMLGKGADVSVGRHSDILDLLGGAGLVGFIPFLWIIYEYLVKMLRKFKNSSVNTLLFIVMLQYCIYGIADHAFSNFEVAFCVFVFPILGAIISRR